MAYVTDTVPPPEADPDGGLRAALVEKIAAVQGFLPILCKHIEFGATAQAKPVLAAMREAGELVTVSGTSAKNRCRRRWSIPRWSPRSGWLQPRKLNQSVGTGSPHTARGVPTVDPIDACNRDDNHSLGIGEL